MSDEMWTTVEVDGPTALSASAAWQLTNSETDWYGVDRRTAANPDGSHSLSLSGWSEYQREELPALIERWSRHYPEHVFTLTEEWHGEGGPSTEVTRWQAGATVELGASAIVPTDERATAAREALAAYDAASVAEAAARGAYAADIARRRALPRDARTEGDGRPARRRLRVELDAATRAQAAAAGALAEYVRAALG